MNVSSHQAQRAVRGALAYSTAKSAVEGLTRATAVDAGPYGIRVNAVALGSIEHARATTSSPTSVPTVPAGSRTRWPGSTLSAGSATQSRWPRSWPSCCSDRASFVSGAVMPVDGGRSARGQDPEET